jgi:hypothetical protein
MAVPGTREWTVAGEVEKYLTAFNGANELHDRLLHAADVIQEFADALRDELEERFDAIASDWPTADELKGLFRDLAQSREQAWALWRLVPKEMRVHLPSPDRIGQEIEGNADDDNDE